MRIIGGKFRGRVLKSLGRHTRPTSSITRKSVFDICKDVIEGARFLDLFAGTGAIGIEALSRGATHVVFVEKDRSALRSIRENLTTLNLENACQILALDALQYLKKKPPAFDIIYIDPPYKEAEENIFLLTLIDELQLLNPGGILFLEEGSHLKTDVQHLPLSYLRWINTRHFGTTLLHQFRVVHNVIK